MSDSDSAGPDSTHSSSAEPSLSGNLADSSHHSVQDGGRRFLQNIFSWLASNVISRVVAALLFILLTQRVSVAETGAYTLGVTFTALLMPILGWGLEHLFIRDVSSNVKLLQTHFARYLLFRLGCGVVAYLLLVCIVLFIDYTPRTQLIVFVLGLMLFSEGLNEFFQAVLVTLEETRYMLYVVGPLNVVRGLAGLLVLWGGGGALGLGAVMLIASVAKAVALGLILEQRHRVFDLLSWNPWKGYLSLRPQLAAMVPFVLIDIFWAIEFQSGQVVLSIFEGEAAAGLYGAAFAILAILMLVGQAYMMTLFPILSRLYHHARDRFAFIYEKSILYMLILGLGIAIGTTLLGEAVLTIIFSESFGGANHYLVPLAWTLPLFFMHVPVSRLMILENAQGRLALYIGVGAVVNVVATIVLIRFLGSTGVGWARLISYSTFFFMNFRYVTQNLYPLDMGSLAFRPLLIVGIACTVAWTLAILGQPWAMTVALPASLFLMLLILTGVVTLDDVRRFRQILQE